MAAVSAAKRAHATLSTTTADTVTLTDSLEQLVVCNHDGSNVLYVTLATAKTAAGVATPTTAVAAAAGTYAIPKNGCRKILESPGNAIYAKLSVVGNGGAYSVEGSRTVIDQ